MNLILSCLVLKVLQIFLISGAPLSDLPPKLQTLEINDSIQSKSPLTDIFKPQNLLNGLNGTNPANNIIPDGNSQPFNLLKNAKLLFLSAQGLILPTDTISNGFTNFIKGLGNNMENLFNTQNIGSLKPTRR